MDFRIDRKRTPRWLFMALLAAFAGVLAWHWNSSAGAEQPGLQTAVVQVTDIERTVLANGTIHPLQLVNVGAQASGRIEALHVKLGDHVARGQLIAQIDPATQANALKSTEATLAQLRAQRASREAQWKQAERAFKRAIETFAQEATSRADYELAEATYEVARADVAVLDAQIRQAVVAVDTARVNLGYTRVIAPIDGTVIAVAAPEGQTLNAVQAAPTIVRLANLDTMTIKAQISEADVIDVRPGQDVYFTILGAPRHRYYATLRAVEPAPESLETESVASSSPGMLASGGTAAAVYYNGLFEIANPARELRPAMTAQVSIILARARQVLGIPIAALAGEAPGGRRTVQVVGADGKVQSRIVSTGIDNGTLVQVIDGLKAGERVVLGEAGS